LPESWKTPIITKQLLVLSLKLPQPTSSSQPIPNQTIPNQPIPNQQIPEPDQPIPTLLELFDNLLQITLKHNVLPTVQDKQDGHHSNFQLQS
jgi:hypothetical protein